MYILGLGILFDDVERPSVVFVSGRGTGQNAAPPLPPPPAPGTGSMLCFAPRPFFHLEVYLVVALVSWGTMFTMLSTTVTVTVSRLQHQETVTVTVS